MKWYGKYGRKVSRIMIRYGQCGRKLWNDMENIEVGWGKDMKNMEEK